MTVELLRLAAGIGMLLAGGELFVAGATAMGKLLRFSSWTVGATLVAFATSAPEFAVNLIAATENHTELAFGNVLGSNIANIGLILGAAAMLRPITLGNHSHERRFVILAMIAAVGLAVDAFARGPSAQIGWPESCVLLVGFVYYLKTLVHRDGRETSSAEKTGWLIPSSKAVSGMAVLALGGDVTVKAAMGLASGLEIPPVFVGLSVVAIGTSLPELFASISALRRGEGALLLGAIIGSNVFNLLFVLSTTTLISPSPMPKRGIGDLLAMAAFSAVLLPFGRSERSLTRISGLMLMLAYACYLTLRFGQGA